MPLPWRGGRAHQGKYEGGEKITQEGTRQIRDIRGVGESPGQEQGGKTNPGQGPTPAQQAWPVFCPTASPTARAPPSSQAAPFQAGLPEAERPGTARLSEAAPETLCRAAFATFVPHSERQPQRSAEPKAPQSPHRPKGSDPRLSGWLGKRVVSPARGSRGSRRPLSRLHSADLVFCSSSLCSPSFSPFPKAAPPRVHKGRPALHGQGGGDGLLRRLRHSSSAGSPDS